MIPLECEFFALRGVALLIETIDKVRDRLNPAIELDGILATMYDSRTLHSREVLERVVDAFGEKVLETVITRTVKFPDATVAGDADHRVRPRAPGVEGLPAAREGAGLPWRGRLRPYRSRGRARPARRRRPGARAADAAETGFRVALTNFEGPFDLLLSLIAKHELDITEVSLSAVTDEFISYLRGLDSAEELDQASEFLVVAATLLDLKVAGLLPQGELVDAEDVALLEARDLLFARLLQYRAFKEASRWFASHLEAEAPRHARIGAPRGEVPPARRPSCAGRSAPRTSPRSRRSRSRRARSRSSASTTCTHRSSRIREQAAHVVAVLRRGDPVTFRELIAGIEQPGVVVARFLAVLELYRHAAIGFEQLEPLGELTLRWAAESWTDENLESLGADYDE